MGVSCSSLNGEVIEGEVKQELSYKQELGEQLVEAASQRSEEELVKRWLQEKADPNYKSLKGVTPLEAAVFVRVSNSTLKSV